MLRTVLSGAQTLAWPSRTVRIDADVFVIGNRFEAPNGIADPDTQPLLVALPIPADAGAEERTPDDFMPTLRSADGAVGRTIAALARERPGVRSFVAPTEVAAALWADLVDEERALCARAGRISCTKAATRAALFRRVLHSADYIQSNYGEPLRIDALAAVSNLSCFHFARLFALVMDETPHAFLVRKRLAVARRLLAAGHRRGDAAERAGFGCRSTLFRHLREAAAVPS